MPVAAVSLVLAEDTVTGGQNLKHPFALVQSRWWVVSGLNSYTVSPCESTTIVLPIVAFCAALSVGLDPASARPVRPATANPAMTAIRTVMERRFRGILLPGWRSGSSLKTPISPNPSRGAATGVWDRLQPDS